MKKALSEMSLNELWELFPIFLTEHRSQWAVWYREEEQRLFTVLGQMNVKINHIGSTAIKAIWAKPIVDILTEIPDDAWMTGVKETLLQNGYVCMAESKNRISFNMGYTENGFAEKVYHLHLRRAGDNDELYFRDFMNDNPQLAKEYEKLKLRLCKKFEHNRDAYTEAKGQFITDYTNRAKQQYKNRY